MKYDTAINFVVNESVNMPNPEREPTKFIMWSEDICNLLGAIYGVDFDEVVQDLQEALGLLED